MTTYYTLAELKKRMVDGNIQDIMEVLAQSRHLVEDAVFLEANQTASHVGIRRTSLPSGTHRQANQGVAAHSSTTRQISEPITRLEDHSKVDEAILDLAADKTKARSQEDLAFVSGLSQTFETDFFYADIDTTPESIDGLAQRYDALSDSYVYDCGGSGDDTTSLWIVDWGPKATHMVYPKGSAAGLQTTDHGRQLTTLDSGTTHFFAWFTQFVWWYGLFISDDRNIQRIANIETSGSENTLDDDLMIEAVNNMVVGSAMVNRRIYCNRTLKTQLDIMAKDKANVNYTSSNAFGEPVTQFVGVPIRLAEGLVNTETAIT